MQVKEVHDAIKMMNSGKSLGMDGAKMEMFIDESGKERDGGVDDMVRWRLHERVENA